MDIVNLNKVFNENDHSSAICWDCGQHTIKKTYKGNATAELSPDSDWVLVVEPMNRENPNNAVVFNCDGVERLRLESPLSKPGITSRFMGVYQRDNVIKVRVTAFQESTRISIESEFDLSLNDLKLVNERPCR